MSLIFWISIFSIFFAYFGYPLVLWVWGEFGKKSVLKADATIYPSVTILIPAYNEEHVIGNKLKNCLELDYEKDKLDILVVSDGSTDKTKTIVESLAIQNTNITFYEVAERQGKANALNTGLANIDSDIVVFSDSSIILEKNSVVEIVQAFADEQVGCVSGEDHIPAGGGEGLYGQYELYLRNQESAIGSIVGASGSFYAQRKIICQDFEEGLAPDFLSVLNTLKQGYRAITEPKAVGVMAAVKESSAEFSRKVRTLLRGMTTLWSKKNLLNIFKYKTFSFFLISHKLMRWLVPFFLITALIANAFILHNSFYITIMILQILFYLVGLLSLYEIAGIEKSLPGKISMYFLIVNLAILAAWYQFIIGKRQEIWEPSKREEQ